MVATFKKKLYSYISPTFGLGNNNNLALRSFAQLRRTLGIVGKGVGENFSQFQGVNWKSEIIF